MDLKILLVDDHQIIREGLRSLIEKERGMKVVGEAANGREAVRLARELAPDVVVMDVSMPDLNGIEATRQIASRVPAARVVALSMHSDRRFVAEMLRAGALGYLLKESAFDELARAVRAVAAGGTYLSPAVAGDVVEGFVQGDRPPTGSVVAALTPRQREVLQLVAEGWTTKRMAAHLHVSPKTIETHRLQVMQTLGIESVAELTKFAVREGLTSLDN
ncbi:MAG TPA: response regulator transcription factor [Phycisphaerae bacterium]|nr:response regulator transcription factor [Phycisphaerae bacterium]HUU90699.1 response regulator transcription factor [Phycisphaerae bacterium]